MFNTTAVLALRALILGKLKSDPPRVGILANWSFAAWLSKNLEWEHFALMGEMEEKEGEEACNQWMVDIMVESGVYKSDEAGWVQGVA